MGFGKFPKGKKNRISVDNKVLAKQSLVDWHASHLSWSYGRLVENDNAYGKEEKEISLQDLPSVYFWVYAKVNNKIPVGRVLGFGDIDNNKGIDRNCVYVEFELKTEFGNIVETIYVDEDNISKKKKNKK